MNVNTSRILADQPVNHDRFRVNQNTQPLKPEWIRVNQATQTFGIGRTKIYELISEGKIKTASIKSRGNVRGTRLLSYDSVAEFINGCIVTINEEGAA